MDPREKVLREYFQTLVLEKGGSRVEKVNLFPHTDYLFLDMERVIQLGELNKKYKDHYVGIEDFTSRLLEGKFSVGSGMSLRLKELHERVERLIEDFEAKAKMEEDIIEVQLVAIYGQTVLIIEEDIANLQEIVIDRVQKYFESLKVRLQNMYHEQNAEIREGLIEARKTLKDELLNVINTQEFFDKNKFFVEFEALKKQPLELEKFLKDYLNNEKTINFQKTMDEHIRKLSPVFHQGFSHPNPTAVWIGKYPVL